MNRKTAEGILASLKKYFADNFNGDVPDLELYSADHEGMAHGSWAINAEGWYDEHGEGWTYSIPQRAKYDIYGIPDNVLLERRASWSLGLHDMDW